jgi:hypothetical protein
VTNSFFEGSDIVRMPTQMAAESSAFVTKGAAGALPGLWSRSGRPTDPCNHRENLTCPPPSTHLIGVWFCVGFFTGAGWAVAASQALLRYIKVEPLFDCEP